MEDILDFFKSMLADVDGQISSKRVVTMLSFFCLVLSFVLNVFVDIKLEEFVYDGMLYLTAAGLGFSTIEKFSRGKNHSLSSKNGSSKEEKSKPEVEDDFDPLNLWENNWIFFEIMLLSDPS